MLHNLKSTSQSPWKLDGYIQIHGRKFLARTRWSKWSIDCIVNKRHAVHSIHEFGRCTHNDRFLFDRGAERQTRLVRLVNIDAHSGEVYNVGPRGDMKQALRSNIEQDAFDYLITNKDIEPSHTVRGWVFVENPAAGLESAKEGRFTVRDVRGNETVRPIKVLTGESQFDEPILLHVGETKDLTQASKQFYSEAKP